jgi:predicted DNA-binding transcriptional regulator AlpA
MTQPAFIRSKDVAVMLGVKTSTLKRWRQLGKGPRGFAYLGDTVVVYTRESVEHFIASLLDEAAAGEDYWRERDTAMLPTVPTAPRFGATEV